MVEYIVKETGYPGTLSQEVVGELIRCKDCRYHIPQDERCRLWCQFVDQLEWCSRAKRKDGESDEAE